MTKNHSILSAAQVVRRHLVFGMLAGGALSLLMRDLRAGEEMHAHHHMHGQAPAGVKRSEAVYGLPELHMLRQDGSLAEFPREIAANRAVLLNFIYTSCTAICPLTTQVFAEVEARLAAEHAAVEIISISIDPEYDTPTRLAEYASKFGAAGDWHFYTGTPAASVALQKAFEVYRGDKMNHLPVTFLRAAGGKSWVRLEGLASSALVLQEFRALPHG